MFLSTTDHDRKPFGLRIFFKTIIFISYSNSRPHEKNRIIGVLRSSAAQQQTKLPLSLFLLALLHLGSSLSDLKARVLLVDDVDAAPATDDLAGLGSSLHAPDGAHALHAEGGVGPAGLLRSGDGGEGGSAAENGGDQKGDHKSPHGEKKYNLLN